MYSRKSLYICFPVLFAGMLFVLSPAVLADSCVNCHKDQKFRVQNRVIYDYYRSWENSVHDIEGVACTDCHGGDASKDAIDDAHRDSFTPLTHTDTESYKKVPSVCGKCHESVLKNFVRSKHYKALYEKGSGPHCATCHGSMNADVYYTSVISRTCSECHNEYTGNSPEVVGTADKILHRINVSRAYRNWLNTNYSSREPEKVREVNSLYNDIVESWHTFDFARIDEQSLVLLNTSKALINRGIAEKRKKEK